MLVFRHGFPDGGAELAGELGAEAAVRDLVFERALAYRAFGAVYAFDAGR